MKDKVQLNAGKLAEILIKELIENRTQITLNNALIKYLMQKLDAKEVATISSVVSQSYKDVQKEHLQELVSFLKSEGFDAQGFVDSISRKDPDS